MNLLQQLHIWKLRSCAAYHRFEATQARKKLISYRDAIRFHERQREIHLRLASRKAFKLEQGKVTGGQSNGLQRPYTQEEMAHDNAEAYLRSLAPNATPFEL